MLGRSDRCRGQLRLFNIRCVVIRVPRRFRVLAPIPGRIFGPVRLLVVETGRSLRRGGEQTPTVSVLSGSCDRDLFRCPLVVFRKRSRTADDPAKGRRCVL